MKKRIIIQKIAGITFAIMLTFSMLFTNIQSVNAAQRDDFNLEAEIALKKAAGIEVYELVDANGNVMGYIQPNVEVTEKETRASNKYSFSWDNVPAKRDVHHSYSHSFIAGDEIYVTIYQNPSGTGHTSYLGLWDNERAIYGFIPSSETTTGWSSNTMIKVGYTGHFSLAISNSSSGPISYSGSYWF